LRSAQAAAAIGARVLLVHAKRAAANAWYERYGFEASTTDPLHLLLRMKDIRASLVRTHSSSTSPTGCPSAP
jgi:hypothetical protein